MVLVEVGQFIIKQNDRGQVGGDVESNDTLRLLVHGGRVGERVLGRVKGGFGVLRAEAVAEVRHRGKRERCRVGTGCLGG